jgi:hypothetical protein
VAEGNPSGQHHQGVSNCLPQVNCVPVRGPEPGHHDNGTQFTSLYFQKYCEGVGIQLCFASVAHPRSNGQVERANAEILRGLKIRTYCDLEKHGAKWVDQLPSVLWGNRTTPSRATGETPFFLVYGAEACLPPEITMGSLRVQAFDEDLQKQQRRQDVDLIDERRW